ncbi:tetratricopeptide repeat protein [Nocardiopsis changdeensis]|uniref:Tetratricopeptide repeat protein n=1 Tax=Nocardiopsis changdeensis TaxID=2831969 RepID=A0ABX8BJY1_9ACTN|nr:MULTISPECIES: hypothetical protein [Nocardiopsis]QUX22516.1 hypothetical protein KGD84_30130 [Nocardiopsis changdeensis]QYX38458.1 hypothetical protein K1J57_07510 [Nocardiopsis sp. MT53]
MAADSRRLIVSGGPPSRTSDTGRAAMGAQPDIFEDLRKVGALKRGLLDRKPSDNALGKHTDVQASRDTVGAWLRGKRFPQQVEPLLGVLAQIRAEAARRDLLDNPADSADDCTVAELMDPDRWRASWEAEQRRRIQANQDSARRQSAHAALEKNERRARQAALADRPRPVGSWSAQRLGVHPAIPGHSAGAQQSDFVLPRYVPRPHDAELRAHLTAAAAEGARPQMVVVRGASCTGKTRTAYEAVTAAAPNDFDLLFPADAEGLLAALAADAVGPRTVLWLNEAQEYLDGPVGEAVAAALLRRLDAAGPLLVIATLWPEHAQALTQRPAPGTEDQHSNARKLLSQARYINVPGSFAEHLSVAREVAHHDSSLAEAVESGAADLTQVLAAGPDLVDHYEHPAGQHGVYGQALISAAMDAYRLGVTGPLTLDFLQAAAPGYLTDIERGGAAPDWFAGALAYACTLVKDTARPLQNVPRSTGMGALPNVVLLTDFLRQHGRRSRHTLCPPTSFWDAAMAHMSDPADLNRLARAAKSRCRYRHSARLSCASIEAGNVGATADLALLRLKAGDREGAEGLLQSAAEAGNTRALTALARLWEKAGNREGAERLLQSVAEAGDPLVLMHLSRLREEAGDREGSEQLLKRAAEAGTFDVVTELVWTWEQAEGWEVVEQFALQALDLENTLITQLAQLMEGAGDQALGSGEPFTLTVRARLREAAGDREEAERLLKSAVEAGEPLALTRLALLLEETGKHQEAELYAHLALGVGDPLSLTQLALRLEESGDREGAERLLKSVAEAGHTRALTELARLREEAGEHEAAEQFTLQALNAGRTSALAALARLRGGSPKAYQRYGLKPDGALAESWEWPEPRTV